jgi:hypothetical protein
VKNCFWDLGEMSFSEMSLGATSLGETSLGETSLGKMSLGETSLGKMSLAETSLGEWSLYWSLCTNTCLLLLGIFQDCEGAIHALITDPAGKKYIKS